MIRLTPAWQANLEAAATRGSGLEHTHDSGGRDDDPRRMAASNDSLTLTLATPAARYGTNTFTLFRCRLPYLPYLTVPSSVVVRGSRSFHLAAASLLEQSSTHLTSPPPHFISLHLTSPHLTLPSCCIVDRQHFPTYSPRYLIRQPHQTLGGRATHMTGSQALATSILTPTPHDWHTGAASDVHDLRRPLYGPLCAQG